MKYVKLGTTGLTVSRLCLGCMTYGSKSWRPWILSEEEGRPIIRKAIEEGIIFFDTADMYSLGVSEEILGRAVRDFSRRSEVVIATKAYFGMGDGPNDKGLSRKHLMDAVENSLKRLGTDYIDLYQIHRWDYGTPIEETMRALNDIVSSGKVRYIGASSMFAHQFVTAQAVAERHDWVRFVSMQNHYNLVYREEEREMIPFCKQTGVAIIPWSPLARGFLAGNRKRGSSGETERAAADSFSHELYREDADYTIAERVAELAQKRELPPAQIALAWLLHKQEVTAPIIGASRMQHLTDAVAALEVKLEPGEIKILEDAYVPHRVLGHS